MTVIFQKSWQITIRHFSKYLYSNFFFFFKFVFHKILMGGSLNLTVQVSLDPAVFYKLIFIY